MGMPAPSGVEFVPMIWGADNVNDRTLATADHNTPTDNLLTISDPVSRTQIETLRKNCAEFGVHHSLPLYSGGLGILAGDHLWTSNAHYPTMAGTYLITPRGTYKNDLVSRVKFTRRPFSVTYYIKKNARWSDGRPITAQDYRFTWQTIMNKSFNILSTIGYEDISSARIINSKTIQFRFKKVFAGWRDMNDYMRENKIEPVPPQIRIVQRERTARARNSSS